MIRLRVTAAEKARWERNAVQAEMYSPGARRRSISAFIRRVVNRSCDTAEGKPRTS